ncbi:MAG: GNAT family protein [Candidatus Pacebacteria bacterium]|nr:GNAT family protein [Candidatus Paceibacterota bacterium]
MEIKGEKVILTPIKSEEKDEFYKLATETEGSKFWYGANGITKEKFFEDWNDSYFDINSPEKGQCFWIVVNGGKIGQINYNEIDLKNKKVELDIIIGDEAETGKGYGTDALKALIKYLFDNFDINKIWIEARGNNPRAIRAYEKVGFKKEDLPSEKENFEGELVDKVGLEFLRNEFLCN